MARPTWTTVPVDTPLPRVIDALNRRLRALVAAFTAELDRETVTEGGVANLDVVGTITVPTAVQEVSVLVVGVDLGGVPNAHTGYVAAVVRMADGLVRVLHDVPHSVGLNQSFTVTADPVARTVTVQNKNSMTTTQSGRAYVRWL